MEKKRILVVYHSETTQTGFMAYNIAYGVETQGVEVDVKEVDKCSPESLQDYDGVVIGSPTYFSNMSWQVKKFIDSTASLRIEGFLLKGKISGAFTSSANREDGSECLRMLELAMGLHHGMKIVSGIVVVSIDDESHIASICREYGEKVATQVLG